jgi:hypothetical protein
MVERTKPGGICGSEAPNLLFDRASAPSALIHEGHHIEHASGKLAGVSDPGGPAGPVAYDPVELRGRIAVCFSAPELRQLAESLGVSGSIAWDRGPKEAVRDLVRQFERYYGLETLVAKLRELRPLVEWPEAQPTGPGSSPFEQGAPPLASPGVLGAPPPAAAEPPPEGPVLQDPLVPSESDARRARAPVWPGTIEAPAPPNREKSFDPRVLIGLTALAVLAAGIAFAAGRASTPTPAPEAANSAAAKSPSAAAKSPSATPSTRPDGPAGRAAAALSRALATIGRDCELGAGTAITAEILARAHEQCGPAPPPPRRALSALPDAAPPPSATPDPPADPPERVRAPKRGGAAPADLPKATGGSCIRSCDAAHSACKAQCGSEPTQSTKYEGYQLCRSRCLAAQSRCRLGCK